MVQELTLVWLSATSLQAHQGELQGWSRANQVTLRPPPTAAAPAYDPAVAEAIEVGLESSRTALAMQQTEGIAVERVCQEIVAHPELPQAAWLLAECHRLAALVLAQRNDALGAARHQRSASALEGTRAAVYSQSPQQLAPVEPAVVVEIEYVGPRASDTLYLDGELTDARTLTTVGNHHLRVLRDDVAVWSGWLPVAAQGGQLQVPMSVPPCSAQELSGIAITGDQIIVPQDVRCPNWGVAQPRPNGTGIAVWRCQGQRCQAPKQWPGTARAADKPATAGAWYVWPLLGVGVALGTAAVLWQTGAFDQPKEPERPFSITGPSTGAPVLSF